MNDLELRQFLGDKELVSLVDRYLFFGTEVEDNRAEIRYELYAKQLVSKRFVLPVAGIQGSGKSTLLDALAFNQPVLPVDADETTCVPVEIAWGNPLEGLVVFQDGREETIVANEESLKHYVHNAYNHGNEKRVDRIILGSDEPFFEKGIHYGMYDKSKQKNHFYNELHIH